jgi:hypothetical protein
MVLYLFYWKLSTEGFQWTCIIFLEEWNSPLRGVSVNLHYLSGGVELSSEGCFSELALSFWRSGTLHWGVFQWTCIIFLEEWNSPLRGVSVNLHYLSGGVKLSSEGCFSELALSFWRSETLLWWVFQWTCINFLEEFLLRDPVMVVIWDVTWCSVLKVN